MGRTGGGDFVGRRRDRTNDKRAGVRHARESLFSSLLSISLPLYLQLLFHSFNQINLQLSSHFIFHSCSN